MSELRQILATNPVFLAPMAGVNDPVFREICKRHGAGLTYGEMVSAQGLAHASQRTRELLEISDAEQPAAIQLFGREPELLGAQARLIEQHCGDRLALIDINMACPVRKVAGKGEGAALLRDMTLAERIIRAVITAVSLPVTVKIRKGFALDEDIAVEFARMSEECGIAAIAVHGRTARQLYHGPSDRSVIERVKAAVRIPVLASGDVFSPEDVADYLAHGADAVMVARGAQGNPWLFGRTQALLAGDRSRAQATVTLTRRIEVAWEHLLGIAERYPRRLTSMRKHLSWYFKATPHAAAVRRAVNSCLTLADYQRLLRSIEERPDDAG